MPIDYSRYPSNWKSEIVPRILERENHKCKWCGLDNKQKVWSVPLFIRAAGRYKIKRFWISDESDMERMKPSACDDVKLVTVVLTIAHLDHDELNHDVQDDRLAALCQVCHLNYDAPEKSRRGSISKSQPSLDLKTN